MSSKKSELFGSISIDFSKCFNATEVKFSSIFISSSDISKTEEPCLENIELDGTAEKTLSLENIPAGKNRIITVRAYNKDKKELPIYTVRAVTDIISGETVNVAPSFETTSYANVIYGLKDFFADLANPGEKTASELEAIKKVAFPVDTQIPPCLFAWNKLVEGYKAFSPLQSRDYYILKPARYSFDYFLADNFTVHIDDPLSNDVFFKKAGKNRLISGIAPGTWNLFIKDNNGKTIEKTEITVSSGENAASEKHLEHDGIAIIVKANEFNLLRYRNCWKSESTESKKTEIKLSNAVCTENNGDAKYFIFDFNATEKIKCAFAMQDGDFHRKKLWSKEIQLGAKGVYLISRSKEESEDGIKIENLAQDSSAMGNFYFGDFKNKISEINYKTFYFDDAKEKRIIMLFNPEFWKTAATTVKAKFTKGINDFGDFYGKTYSFVKDSETGIFYAVVPYSEIRETNQSGQPTYRLEVNGTEFNCVSKLNENGLSGYVYTKYTSKTAQNSFPCIIYERQNKKTVISRLEHEKSYRRIEDFNLSCEKDLMELANFRLVPGTTKLFRSYHPYLPSKNEYETEPYRIYALGILGKKYGIKADINISSDKDFSTSTIKIFNGKKNIVSIENYQPEYYRGISEGKNIFFILNEMPNFGYDMCYSESDSVDFAKSMAAMVKFVNEKEGPYQLHCAIGTDRTGIACAIFATLCGAEYADLEEDYCASVNMGINEYRGPGCVKYALEQFLGYQDIYDFNAAEIQQMAIKNLVEKGGITESETINAIKRLGGTIKA